MNRNSNFNREEAFELFNLLVGEFPVDALLAEPQQLGSTLAKTAVTLAQEFNKSVGVCNIQPPGENFGCFGAIESSVYFGRGDDWHIVRDVESRTLAVSLAKSLNSLIGVFD